MRQPSVPGLAFSAMIGLRSGVGDGLRTGAVTTGGGGRRAGPASSIVAPNNTMINSANPLTTMRTLSVRALSDTEPAMVLGGMEGARSYGVRCGFHAWFEGFSTDFGAPLQ